MAARTALPVVASCLLTLAAGCGSDAPRSQPATMGGTSAQTAGAVGTAGAVSGGGAGAQGGSSAAGGSVEQAGAAGAAEPPSGKVPVFVAQGDIGRTIVSCDDGQTWVGDRAWDKDGDALVCGSTQPMSCNDAQCSYLVGGACMQEACCSDSPDIAKGIIYGADTFVATWGWGQPGALRSSRNAIDWTTTHPADTFGGLAFGGGRFVVASRAPFWSSDGQSWTAGDAADFRNQDGSTMWSVRRFAYADFQGGGRFVAVASGDTDRDMLVSSDGGQSWWRPDTIPADCAHDVSTYGGIVGGNDIIVIVDQHANACRSTDGGKTWSVTPTGLTEVLSHGVWTGSEFQFWGDDSTRISSSDGVTWTQTPMATPIRLGPVARSPEGTLVGLNSVWDGYDKQQFWRSTDGLTWTELDAGAFVASHPIFYIAFGYAEPSDACPAL